MNRSERIAHLVKRKLTARGTVRAFCVCLVGAIRTVKTEPAVKK